MPTAQRHQIQRAHSIGEQREIETPETQGELIAPLALASESGDRASSQNVEGQLTDPALRNQPSPSGARCTAAPSENEGVELELGW